MTTSVFYPDASPEVSSVDGSIERFSANQSWASHRDAAAGHDVFDNAVEIYIFIVMGNVTPNTFSGMGRGFTLFDTASIPDADTISDAVLTLTTQSLQEDIAAMDLDVVSSSPASNTGLVVNDYNDVGTTVFASRSVNSSGTPDTAYDWTLDANGKNAVVKTGVTKFGLRLSPDTDNVPPTGNLGDTVEIDVYSADEAGSTNDPKLTVTHSGAGASFVARSVICT